MGHNREYEGKIIKRLSIAMCKYSMDVGRATRLTLELDDGTRIQIRPSMGTTFIVEESRLIEPTLSSDVIPIGANTLGEGSV